MILGPRTEQEGRIVRVHSAPVFMRPDGKTWRRIDELVTVEQTAKGYRITALGKTIDLEAATAAALNNATKRHILGNRHFGPVLDSAKATNTMRWRVTKHPDVKAVANGYEIASADGVSLGLFLDDWKRTLGTDMAFDPVAGTIDLDLRKAKARGSEINLDPVTVFDDSPYQSGTIEVATNLYATTCTQAQWDQVMAGSGANIVSLTATVGAENVEWPAAPAQPIGLVRGYFSFDVGSISGTVVSAKIRAYLIQKNYNLTTVRMQRITPYDTLGVEDWHPTYGASYGDLVCEGFGVWQEWTVPPEEIPASGAFCVAGRVAPHDTDGTPPNTPWGGYTQFAGPGSANAPYLELEVEAAAALPAARMALTGVGS